MNSKFEIVFFLLLLIATSVLLFLVFFPFLQALLLGAIGALIFHPFYLHLIKLTNNRKTLSALLTLLTILLVILVPLILLGSQLFTESRAFYEFITSGQYTFQLQEIEQSINQSLSDWTNTSIQLQIPEVESGLQLFASWIALNSGAIVGGVFSIIFKLLIGIAAFYYFLKNGVGIKNEIVAIVPLTASRTKRILDRCDVTVRSVVEGSLVVALVQGILLGIGFAIFNIPQAVLWGSIAVIAALIPGVGTMLILIPALIYSFALSSLTNTIGLAIWGFFIVGLADNLIRPTLMQRYLVIHPFFIFLSVIGGIIALGPLGFIWGPIILSLFLLLLDLYKEIILGRE